MDLAAGLGLLGCIVGFSLLGTFVSVDMMDDCENIRSDAVTLKYLNLVRLWPHQVVSMDSIPRRLSVLVIEDMIASNWRASL